MSRQFARTQLLLGPEAMEKLAHSRVAVFGWVALEAMCARPWLAVVWEHLI